MAVLNRKYGKDKVPRSSEGYISEALADGNGPSEGIMIKSIGEGQTINTAVAMDNNTLVYDIESSICDESGFGGGPENLKHSLTGASAVMEGAGETDGVHYKSKDHRP